MTVPAFENRESDRFSAPESPRTLRWAVRHFLDYPSPRVVIVITLLALATRVAVGGWSGWDLVVVGTLLAIWPVQEWLIHVFILHYRPQTIFGRVIDFPVPRSHRAHHRDPWTIATLFIPTHVFWYAIPLEAAFWFGAMPTPAIALTGLSTYFLLTAHYEWVHYLVHTRYRPKSWLYDRLWRNHRLHHCKNERYWFGVTMLAADRVFGTAPPLAQAATSNTCRTLGFESNLGVAG